MPESGFSLSWFGLTDGWYDVVVGEHRLFSTPGDAWAVWDRDARQAADPLGEVAELAVAWWSHRTVDSSHLRGAPVMNLWRDGDDLHVRWRSHPSGTDAPAWCSPDGDAIVSVQCFRDELVSFDHDLRPPAPRLEPSLRWRRPVHRGAC